MGGKRETREKKGEEPLEKGTSSLSLSYSGKRYKVKIHGPGLKLLHLGR